MTILPTTSAIRRSVDNRIWGRMHVRGTTRRENQSPRVQLHRRVDGGIGERDAISRLVDFSRRAVSRIVV